MTESEMLDRLERDELLGKVSAEQRQALAAMSEDEFEVLKSLKARLDDAVGGPQHHSPRDGAVFW